MSSAASSREMSGPKLAFTRLSPPDNQKESTPPPQTILFLHGGESCHLEFLRVVPFLQDEYQILLVDLPAHSRSREIPFSFDNAVSGLAHLIKTHAEDNHAHIVGLSLGGFIGLDLARRHPELVRSLWCTGCAPFSGFKRWAMSRSFLLSGLVSIAGQVANDSIFWASFGKDVEPIAGLRAEVQSNQNIRTLKPMFDELALFTLYTLAQIEDTRVAIIAGGKQDSVKDTLKAGNVLRERNPQSNAFVVRDAIHWWSLQLPEIFAHGVKAWIEGKDMPKAFEPLLTDI